MPSLDTQLLNSLLENLDEREKTIVMGRFGLSRFEEPQSLAALGEHYGITRERVRQIEEKSLQSLKEKAIENQLLKDIINRSQRYLNDSGGVARSEEFVNYHQRFFPGISKNHFGLLIEIVNPFYFHPENDEFWAFYYLDEDRLEKARDFINEWIDFLKKRKEEILTKANYRNHFQDFHRNWKIRSAHAENYVKVSRRIHVNFYGDIGLAEWPEIRPLTTRDRIYLILKKKNLPLHFKEIAKNINESGLSRRKALATTVHNELIKDKRFVLVGRGIYGLAEHGYEPGTASEVIQRILRKNGPLPPRKIIMAIQEERFFRPNTILVNLQNRRFFERLPDGTYRARRS